MKFLLVIFMLNLHSGKTDRVTEYIETETACDTEATRLIAVFHDAHPNYRVDKVECVMASPSDRLRRGIAQ